jgi:hypothetical protein
MRLPPDTRYTIGTMSECRGHALVWLEIAGRSEAFKDQANHLAEQWLTLAILQDWLNHPADLALLGPRQGRGTIAAPGH